MPPKARRVGDVPEAGPPTSRRLPKNAIARLNVGLSFAEYDSALLDPDVFVHTPAFNAALDPDSGKFFFVGRRGTGKTAIRTYCASQLGNTRVLIPEIFSPSSEIFNLELLENTKRGPFRSLVAVFKRALLDELILMWRATHETYFQMPGLIEEELRGACSIDFDERTLSLIRDVSVAVGSGDDSQIVAINKATKTLATEMKALSGTRTSQTLLVDSIDDFWDGSDLAVTYLAAFVHACLEVSTQIPWARTLLFLRENIFERVRARDSESSRVETSVSGLDWNQRLLLELVEKRLNRGLSPKLPLGGATWSAYFEDGHNARSEIFGYCHNRPRDVLIYVSHAIDLAKEHGHDQIMLEDVSGARRRFSDNRFKDLGDEYAENFPNIATVLRRFYGLGRRYTIGGIESLIDKLMADAEVTILCGDWIFGMQDAVKFVRLLYNIGFVGLRTGNAKTPRFRALGPQDTSPPAIAFDTEIHVHKCYWDALDLQDVLVRDLPKDRDFGRIGQLLDLPGGLDPTTYAEQLDDLFERLGSIPVGRPGATAFEDAVGDMLRLCFFRALDNIEPRSRSADGVVIRDWIAANRASSGFWEVMRSRYDATQVIWECKNYEALTADDFHQSSYYMNSATGRLVVIAFRGDIHPGNYEHIRRISSDRNGLVFPLGIRDLKTFVRQHRNGKVRETHVQERYDSLVRRIS